MNHPSVESSDLTTVRKIVPQATLPKGEKVGRVDDQGGRCEGKKKERTLEKYRVSDSRE